MVRLAFWRIYADYVDTRNSRSVSKSVSSLSSHEYIFVRCMGSSLILIEKTLYADGDRVHGITDCLVVYLILVNTSHDPSWTGWSDIRRAVNTFFLGK